MENCVAPGLDGFDVLLEVVLSSVRVSKEKIKKREDFLNLSLSPSLTRESAFCLFLVYI